MKYQSIKISLFTIISALLLICPGDADAQVKTTSNTTTTNTKKPTRIFYGLGSYYANKFHGRKTASGEIFDQQKMTCACNMLPLGTWIKVTNLRNDRSVIVKINDRLHPNMKRIVDLTRSAAQKLGYISRGVTRVKIEVIGKKRKS